MTELNGLSAGIHSVTGHDGNTRANAADALAAVLRTPRNRGGAATTAREAVTTNTLGRSSGFGHDRLGLPTAPTWGAAVAHKEPALYPPG